MHFVGDKVLRVFGAGELADTLADVEGDALPDWARTAKQKQQRAAELIKRAAEESKREEARRGKEDSQPVWFCIATVFIRIGGTIHMNSSLLFLLAFMGATG